MGPDLCLLSSEAIRPRCRWPPARTNIIRCMRRLVTSTTPFAMLTVTAWPLLASLPFQKVSAFLAKLSMNYNDARLLMQRRKNTMIASSFASLDANSSTRHYLVSWPL